MLTVFLGVEKLNLEEARGKRFSIVRFSVQNINLICLLHSFKIAIIQVHFQLSPYDHVFFLLHSNHYPSLLII